VVRSVEQSSDAARKIVAFCRFVRAEGFSVGVQDTLAALSAAAALGGDGGEDLEFALRCVLCASKDDWDRFDECFKMFWSPASPESLSPGLSRPRKQRTSREGERDARSLMSTGSGDDVSSTAEGAQAVAGASTCERLTKADFSTLPQSDMPELEQIALRLFKQMRQRLARRRKSGCLRGQVDLRKTIRQNLSRGGVPLNLRYRERKPRPHRLVTMLDISGSMSPYSLFLVKFLYALQKQFRHVDTFLFSTRLVEITTQLRSQNLQEGLRALSQQPTGWSGGTNIRGSLRELNRLHRPKLRSSDTLFVILSDGWDTGEPEILATELSALKRRVRKLIWLNPLLGLKDYRPLTRGMSAALPHIDIFAPAHNLESLLALERHFLR
jgi:uncharacterized protein